ncbi:superinfection immunity protein [Burkholderia gladioli]|uniref:superinfection immunity protein n=1 Tax=Burkholderia gladioli TaxID=28095 RepID=UPI000CFF8A79|nr:superinfection immunity protein [Burkholderia gladioli]MBU9171992.1 superinfection immunity protein [Burkholderia gladioli]MBU9193623.1 superinfection immunity protein [Burkholderia gladioli]MBU9218535.1 superinfection immunity protein [Burkholderia gladioli]MDN7721984.1 superinfection immunity protein [Burkholderia gladioli]MDN7800636.1 superinfection immunity protein [Burkholderia gladioli]
MKILFQMAGAVIAIAFYFLPAIIADRRGRHDKLTLALFNALFGWTGIGWLMTLYWASLPNPARNLAGNIVQTRRSISMRKFSNGLVDRVQNRVALQQAWIEKQDSR